MLLLLLLKSVEIDDHVALLPAEYTNDSIDDTKVSIAYRNVTVFVAWFSMIDHIVDE